MRLSATIVAIYPENQWDREGFYRLLATHEQREARVAAAYSGALEPLAIRAAVLDAILTHAIPAGNA